MNHNFFAIFHHNSLNLPIVMEISTEEKFFELCNSFPTDWAEGQMPQDVLYEIANEVEAL